MHGSVSEWCQDLYQPLSDTGPVSDPIQVRKGWKRVFRGGNRFNDKLNCSAFFCDYAWTPPDVGARGFGLRIAASAVPKKK
jgi:formylglycine-generating enzyme required for sulfatase activity